MADRDVNPEFLKELEALYRKYNLVIDSCGCCDSPHVSELPSQFDTIEEAIKHLKEGSF